MPTNYEYELLLAAVLNVPRAYLYAHPVDTHALSQEQQHQLTALLERRAQGEPIAYILGSQGFWTLDLEVNPHALIPRPCTERLVELVLAQLPIAEPCQVIDLGTGSGAIALALASERPHWQLIATDKDPKTLALAKRNATRHQLNNLQFFLSNWCAQLPELQVNAIVSNPPYIKINDPHLDQGDLRFEPKIALVSGKEGLTALKKIIQTSQGLLRPGGQLFLEHGFDQRDDVSKLMQQAGYRDIQHHQDLESHDRVVIGRL